MRCEQLVVVGDAHLGPSSRPAEDGFLAFLEAVPSLGDGLLVTGDLFEFWFSYRRSVPRDGVRVAGSLGHLARRLPVLMVGGNHDRWGGSFWTEELGIAFAPGEARFEAAGLPGLVVHGDGITERSNSARFLHKLTRHSLTIGLFQSLHPDLGLWLVDRLSGHLAETDRDPATMAACSARQVEWAGQAVTREPGLRLVVMGHSHEAAVVPLPGGAQYLNPGPWFDGFRYATVARQGVELRRFGA